MINMIMTFEQLFSSGFRMSLAVSIRIIRTPYCPILTFEDDFTYKYAKDKSDCYNFLLPVLSKYNG